MNYSNNIATLKPSHIKMALNLELDANTPVFLWGPPGVGKSDIVREIARERGIEIRDIRAILLDPVDLRGIPSTENGVTRWNPPAFLPTEGEGILFLDELNAAPPAVAAALYELVLDRRIGEYTLPDGWRIVAAGNGESDRAVTNRMPTPLANRFSHYEIATDLGDWIVWASKAGVDSRIMAFLKFRPALLHDFDPRSGSKAFPTPRSWEVTSRKLAVGLPKEIEFAAIAAAVGSPAAIELTGFLAVASKLPSFELIIRNPEETAIPTDDSSALYALAAGIGKRATPTNIGAAWTYLKRMGEEASREFAVLAMTIAVNTNEANAETAAYIDYCSEYDTTLL